VPNLAHTGIRSNFTFTGEPVLRPDGSVSNLLRRHIANGFKELPMNPKSTVLDRNDMAYRDKEKRRMKGERMERRLRERRAQEQLEAEKGRPEELEEGSESYGNGGVGGGGDFDEPSLNETQLSAMEKIVSRRPTSPERQKKPFSDDSLFTALLENQVGGNGDRWDLAETLE
jgi:hypothetical protein